MHWLHLFDFSSLCIFRCVPKLPALWLSFASSYLGSLLTKNAFLKQIHFLRQFFRYQPYLVKTPPTGFWLFSSLFLPKIVKTDYFFKYLDVYTSSLKIWLILVQNWWINNCSKLTTLNPVFQLLHSALIGDPKTEKDLYRIPIGECL